MLYAIFGFVFYAVAMGMVLGPLWGVQIGGMVTRVVKGVVIRAFYGLNILAGFSSRVCALIRKLADSGYIELYRKREPKLRRGGQLYSSFF